MVKKKINEENLKKFFGKMRKDLQRLGKETSVWIKKGEREISRLSRIGKLELDIVKLNMKKEKLLKDIGRRMVELGLSGEISDSAVRDMDSKVNAIMEESRKKKTEMSRIGRGLLKKSPTKSKKKK